ncbi:MAG TPA: hypothetical protein VL992_07265 [Tepidisphaeraceae bacterium]|nr:hypothetical protein [Tepidisphaeraceae bacterium]
MRRLIVIAIVVFLATSSSHAGVEAEGWGDLRGFRIDGELMPLTTSLVAAAPGWKRVANTGHWHETDLSHERDGAASKYGGVFAFEDGQSIEYQYTLADLGHDRAQIDIAATARSDLKLNGIYFQISAPLAPFAGGQARLLEAAPPTTQNATVATAAGGAPYLDGVAGGVEIDGKHRQIVAKSSAPRVIQVRDSTDHAGDHLNILLLLHAGDCAKGETIHATITISETGDPDHAPAHLALDATKLGRPFDGIGGNFVWGVTSPIARFNLENLHLVQARVGMFLATFAPRDSGDFDSPQWDESDKDVIEMRQSLQFARELTRRGIPLIFSLWIAPNWALSNPAADPYEHGRLISPDKWDDFCRAVRAYLLFARREYGVEADLFSFNESDLGVTIKLTGEEHRDAIERLGECFSAGGLKTRLLLGDVSNPTPEKFIEPALADPEAMRYVGAISYHMWNGGTRRQLSAWHPAAERAGLPLLVDEGGLDPEVYHYRFIGDEAWYAFEEAALYLDVLDCSQPAIISPWQMTPDFALEDIDGSGLTPTKRFWFLKQLSETTPAGAIHCRVDGDCPAIHAAAFLDRTTGRCVVQIVNIASSRPVTVTGVPADIRSVQVYLTDLHHSFQKMDSVSVGGGAATVQIPAMCYLTLTGATAN